MTKASFEPRLDFLSFAALKFDRTALAHAESASSRPPATVIGLISSSCATRSSNVVAFSVDLPFSNSSGCLPYRSWKKMPPDGSTQNCSREIRFPSRNSPILVIAASSRAGK